MANSSNKPKYRGWQIALVVIIAIILLFIAVPAVRASLSAWLGLSVAPTNEATAVPVTLEALVTSTPSQGAVNEAAATSETVSSTTQVSSTSGNIDFAKLSSQIGWEVLTPSWLPEGYEFVSAYFDTNQKMLVLTYIVTRPLPGTNDPSLTSSETITLLEAQSNDFIPMQIAPDTTVTDVQVNGNPAAFTQGGWDTQFVKDNNAPGGGKMVSSWRNDLHVKNLYWQLGKVYLTLVTADEQVSQQDLIDIAASVGK